MNGLLHSNTCLVNFKDAQGFLLSIEIVDSTLFIENNQGHAAIGEGD